MMYDLIIIGSGAAGLSAGIYAGRYRMKTVIFGPDFGGTAIAGSIENYPGIKTIDGYDLMKNMLGQAKDLGCEYVDEKVTSIKNDNQCFEISTNDRTYQTNTVILATGARRRMLGLANEKELIGRGVHYCVTCDGPIYRDKTIAIVGGGDASIKGVNLAEVDNIMRTNTPGVFATGDVTNFFGQFKQDISAAAMGSVAATSVYEEHKIHGNLCLLHAKPSNKYD